MKKDIKLLKKVLSIPTVTYKEDLMVEFLCEWLEKNSIPFFVDKNKNVYATKGKLGENEYYPCVVSHTDTVHTLKTMKIKEELLPNAQKDLKRSFKAYDIFGYPTGIGGDDKCGVFACLKLLRELPYLKAAFFVSEETGCHGSRAADKKFFSNVGYAIQFDAPENWMVSESCSGQILFDRNSDFFNACDQVLCENMDKRDMEYMSHPYTDVYALKTSFDFSCINFSIGYYNYHTKNEYVVIEDVFNGIKIGRSMIKKLGYKLYYKKSEPSRYSYKII